VIFCPPVEILLAYREMGAIVDWLPENNGKD
jgi:hypothetical protein